MPTPINQEVHNACSASASKMVLSDYYVTLAFVLELYNSTNQYDMCGGTAEEVAQQPWLPCPQPVRAIPYGGAGRCGHVRGERCTVCRQVCMWHHDHPHCRHSSSSQPRSSALSTLWPPACGIGGRLSHIMNQWDEEFII